MLRCMKTKDNWGEGGISAVTFLSKSIIGQASEHNLYCASVKGLIQERKFWIPTHICIWIIFCLHHLPCFSSWMFIARGWGCLRHKKRQVSPVVSGRAVSSGLMFHGFELRYHPTLHFCSSRTNIWKTWQQHVFPVIISLFPWDYPQTSLDEFQL